MSLVEETAMKWQQQQAARTLEARRDQYNKIVAWLGSDLASAFGLHYTEVGVYIVYDCKPYRVELSVNGSLSAWRNLASLSLLATGVTPGEFCSYLLEALKGVK